jgi:hypothetical protein
VYMCGHWENNGRNMAQLWIQSMHLHLHFTCTLQNKTSYQSVIKWLQTKHYSCLFNLITRTHIRTYTLAHTKLTHTHRPTALAVVAHFTASRAGVVTCKVGIAKKKAAISPRSQQWCLLYRGSSWWDWNKWNR